MKDNRLIVIGHYYPNREGNLYEIVNHLTDLNYRVLIWDNNPGHYHRMPQFLTLYGPQVEVVRCPNNPIHGRYLAALIYPEIDYFLFQDDDLLLEKDTIERLFAGANYVSAPNGDWPRFVGIEGRQLDWDSDKPYTNAIGLIYPGKPDMLVRAYAGNRRAVIHGLEWVLAHGIAPGRCETLLFTAGGILVEGTRFKNLPEHGTGLCHAGQAHWDEIDAFANKYIRPHHHG